MELGKAVLSKLTALAEQDEKGTGPHCLHFFWKSFSKMIMTTIIALQKQKSDEIQKESS